MRAPKKLVRKGLSDIKITHEIRRDVIDFSPEDYSLLYTASDDGKTLTQNEISKVHELMFGGMSFSQATSMVGFAPSTWKPEIKKPEEIEKELKAKEDQAAKEQSVQAS